MTVRHLTDEQIQEWLDGAQTKQPAVFEHLAHCSRCQAEVAAYRKLYQELNQPIVFSLSPDFAATVTQRVQAGKFRFSSQWWSGLLIAGGFLLGTAINVHYLGKAAILAGLDRIKTQFVNFVLSFETLKNAAVSLNVNHSLFFFAVIVLILTFLLDRFILQHRKF